MRRRFPRNRSLGIPNRSLCTYFIDGWSPTNIFCGGSVATTLNAGFAEFLDYIRATRAESVVAANHRASIQTKLQASFGMTSFFRTGYFGNGTNISGYSDIDYFAVFPRNRLKQDSRLSLQEVAAALRERFSTTSGIRVNTPGVQVPFGLDGANATEIVPADETGLTKLGFRQFDIPDGAGGWKFSAPLSHNAYVSEIDNRLGGTVKPLIRFVKAWKFYRSVPVKSFYLELYTAKYADNERTIVYDIDIERIFTSLLADGLPDFQDPRFPNDPFTFRACNTELQRQDALQKLSNAFTWADQAVDYRSSNVKAAFVRWDLVFNHNFPAYTGN
jgi:Second Messenger Oligonucleotide or Dinucleotide Synthetase domain